MIRAALPLVLSLVACSSSPHGDPPAPHNTASPSTGFALAPSDPLGALAFVADSAPAYAAVSPTADVPARTSVSAIANGSVITLVAAPRLKIAYGCDGNALEVTPFNGPRLPPGLVWILPPNPRFTPAALPITAARTATAAHFTLGPLVVDLARRDAAHGTLVITRDGRTIHTAPFERGEMAGAPVTPLDLTADVPGVPHPVAAWSLTPTGPFLLVLEEPGFEGTTFAPLLVDATGARPVDALTLYLYRCAF